MFSLDAVSRIVIGLTMIYFVFQETGPMTAIFALLVLIRSEMDVFMMLYVVKRVDELKKRFPL